MTTQLVVVLITAPSVEVGQAIAQTLLEKKLAACINILPGVQSFYTWQGQLNHDEEALLIVKTRADLFQEKFIPTVQAIHPYQVPEIIAVPIQMGLPAYLDWIEQETKI